MDHEGGVRESDDMVDHEGGVRESDDMVDHEGGVSWMTWLTMREE